MLKSPGLKLRRVFAGWEVDRCISVATNEGTIADIPGIGNISPVGTFGVSSASLEEGTESEDELIPFMEKTGLKNEFCSVLEPFKAISPKMEEGSLNDSFPSPSYKLCHCILCQWPRVSRTLQMMVRRTDCEAVRDGGTRNLVQFCRSCSTIPICQITLRRMMRERGLSKLAQYYLIHTAQYMSYRGCRRLSCKRPNQTVRPNYVPR